MIKDPQLLDTYQAGVYDGLRIKTREGSQGIADIYLMIALNPGTTRAEMNEYTPLSPVTIGYHATRLLECGFIREQRVSQVIHYFPNPRAYLTFPENGPLTRRKKEKDD